MRWNKSDKESLFKLDWGYPMDKEYSKKKVFGMIVIFSETKSCLYRIDYYDEEAKYYKLDLSKESDGTYLMSVYTGSEYESSSNILQASVSKIYNNLRIVAIVALLTILVYVGIRMVLSSAAKDKAKYKQMLVDWLVAFIMLFVLHYIMAFTIDISEKLTNICSESNIENIPLRIPNATKLKGDDR